MNLAYSTFEELFSLFLSGGTQFIRVFSQLAAGLCEFFLFIATGLNVPLFRKSGALLDASKLVSFYLSLLSKLD